LTLFLSVRLGLFTTAAWAALTPGDAAPESAQRRAGKASVSHGGVGERLRVKVVLERGSTIEAGRIT